MLGQVHGRCMMGDLRFFPSGNGRRDSFEHFLVLQCVPVTLVDDIIYTLTVERQHVITVQLMVDIEVKHFHCRSHGGRCQKGDGLHEEVGRGIQLVQFAVDGHVRADDYVGSHGPGDVNGEVVTHAAVQQDLSVLAHSPEIEWYGHGGTESVRDASAGPVFGCQGIKVRCDAGVWDGEVGETDVILISDAHAA